MRIADDGYHFHQSDIETFAQCPEKGRRSVIAGMNDEIFNSDAAYVGTCFHGCIEKELADGPFKDLFAMKQFAAYFFLDGLETMVAHGATTYSRETFGDDIKALKALELLCSTWYDSTERDMLMHMDPDDIHIEWEFDSPFAKSSIGTPIFLEGRTDLVIPSGVWDWKSASGEYKAWEKQRWAAQPSVYLWAASQAGLINADEGGRYLFHYKVAVRRAKPQPFQSIPIYRTEASFGWLERIVVNMANYVETVGFEDEWLLNDHSVLCSPKWCPFWDTCKGKHIGTYGNEWH